VLLLRDVQKADLPSLNRLAAVLNTVNLPDEEETLERLKEIHYGVVRDEARPNVDALL